MSSAWERVESRSTPGRLPMVHVDTHAVHSTSMPARSSESAHVGPSNRSSSEDRDDRLLQMHIRMRTMRSTNTGRGQLSRTQYAVPSPPAGPSPPAVPSPRRARLADGRVQRAHGGASDVDILLLLRDSLTGLNKVAGWSDLPIHRDASRCAGVVTSSGWVTTLGLSGLGLSGSLPAAIGHLAELQVFTCEDNKLSGN